MAQAHGPAALLLPSTMSEPQQPDPKPPVDPALSEAARAAGVPADASPEEMEAALAANAAELAGSAAAGRLLPIHEEFHRQSRAIADEIRSGAILVMADPAIVAYLALSEQIEDLLRRLKAELQPVS